MILVDANLLLYAVGSDFPQHAHARQWLEDELVQAPRVGLPWSSLLAFVRLSTNPRMFERPLSIPAAWSQVESWLSADSSWIPLPGDKHAAILGDCLNMPGLRANDVPDAHLAALAIEHGLSLATHDTGFARFPLLRWFTP